MDGKSFALCEVKTLDSSDPNGEFEAILSAPTLDRDGEVIEAGAFNPLPDRIPIDVDHGMTVDSTVGSGSPFYDGDLLKIRGRFASTERAQTVRTLIAEGHVDRMSVTFMNADRQDKDGVPHIVHAELLNAAFVPIPSNRQAAVLMAKAFQPDSDELKATKADRLQSIHDLAVANGAVCGKAAHVHQDENESEADAPETPAAAGKSPVSEAGLAYLRALADAAATP